MKLFAIVLTSVLIQSAAFAAKCELIVTGTDAAEEREVKLTNEVEMGKPVHYKFKSFIMDRNFEGFYVFMSVPTEGGATYEFAKFLNLEDVPCKDSMIVNKYADAGVDAYLGAQTVCETKNKDGYKETLTLNCYYK